LSFLLFDWIKYLFDFIIILSNLLCVSRMGEQSFVLQSGENTWHFWISMGIRDGNEQHRLVSGL